MVVLAAAVLTKSGKPLISRQFVGLPRARIESLLSSFPRLVAPTSEHTVVESSGVRFVYNPLETLYVVLITNTQSNILLDLSTLSLVSRIVTDLATSGRGGQITELDVGVVAFDILGAWDEVVSLGWRENVNLHQVRQTLEMESHEEKIQEIIARNKEQEAKEELKRRAKQLELQRREMLRRGQNPYVSGSGTGFGSGGGMPSRPYAPSAPAMPSTPPGGAYDSPRETAKPFRTKGMQLGSKKGPAGAAAGLAEALGGLDVGGAQSAEEEELIRRAQAAFAAQQPAATPSAPSPAPPTPVVASGPPPPLVPENPFPAVEPREVHVAMREKLELEVSRDGVLNELSLKGDLDLRISNPAYASVFVTLPRAASLGGLIGDKNDLQFKTHPNVDKKAWADKGEIRLKEGKKGFPVNQALGVLKWRLSGKDDKFVPVSITCWPSVDMASQSATISLEYELTRPDLALHSFAIALPIPPGALASVDEEPSVGQCSYDDSRSAFIWTVDVVSEQEGTQTGSLEIAVRGLDDDVVSSALAARGGGEDADDDDDDDERENKVFFPVNVAFVLDHSVCGLEVLAVSAADGSSLADGEDYSVDVLSSTDRYAVV